MLVICGCHTHSKNFWIRMRKFLQPNDSVFLLFCCKLCSYFAYCIHINKLGSIECGSKLYALFVLLSAHSLTLAVSLCSVVHIVSRLERKWHTLWIALDLIPSYSNWVCAKAHICTFSYRITSPSAQPSPAQPTTHPSIVLPFSKKQIFFYCLLRPKTAAAAKK